MVRRLIAHELFDPVEFAEICDDQLLRCLLKSTLICDTKLEQFLTATRQMMLEAASAGTCSQQLEERRVRLLLGSVTAVFHQTSTFLPTRNTKTGRQNVTGAVGREPRVRSSVPELWLAAVAAYFPLASLPAAEFACRPTLVRSRGCAVASKCGKGRKSNNCRPPCRASPPSRTACHLMSNNNTRKTHIHGG